MSTWKFTGKIYKEFDKNIQGYISILSKDNCSSKMEIPSNNKAELALTHSYVVFQMFLMSNKSLLIEISVSDLLKVIFSLNVRIKKGSYFRLQLRNLH